MAGNTPLVSKSSLQKSVEKSTCGSEFVACGQVIDAVLTVRDQVRCFGCTVEEASRIFCDNKGVVLAGCGMNMLIKKRSAALAFHKTRESIAAGAIELQHIGGDKNWSDFLTKAVDNVKFMSCTKALMVPCAKAMNS